MRSIFCIIIHLPTYLFFSHASIELKHLQTHIHTLLSFLQLLFFNEPERHHHAPLNQLFDEILDSTTLSIYQIKLLNHHQVNQIIVISYQDIYAHIYTYPTY